MWRSQELLVQVLSCVDWLGPLPMNPQLLQAVVIATEDHQLETVIPKDLHTQSFIALNVNAVQRAVSSRSRTQSRRYLVESSPVEPKNGILAVRCSLLLVAICFTAAALFNKLALKQSSRIHKDQLAISQTLLLRFL